MGKKEAEGHKHNDNCYESKSECGKEEHVHTLECYSDVKADVEDSAKWKKMFKDVKLGDDWGENVLTIAKTQIGYQESKKNYEVAEDGTTLKGYTRYGAWSGKNYIDWDGAFASYVLNYAQVPEKGFPTKPEDMDTVKWMNKLSESKLLGGTDAQPEVGDLVFFKRKVNNAEKNFVGIISKVEKDTDEKITYIKVIEGNYRFEEKDIVKENRYAYTDSSIQAYGLLSVAEKNYKGTDEVEKEETTEAAKEQAAEEEVQEETTKRQIFKTARNEEKTTADETLQSDSRDAANDTVQSGEAGMLPVTAITGSDTIYNPETEQFKTDVRIDFQFENKTQVQAGKEYTFTYPNTILFPPALVGPTYDLYDGTTKAGTYSFVKNEDGSHTIKVVFDQSYIDTAGDVITGKVICGGTLNTSTENGSINIPIQGSDLSIDIGPEEIDYPKDETDKYNIMTGKSGYYKPEDDKLYYTVYVRSTKGTPDVIEYRDELAANGLDMSKLGTPTVKVEQGTYRHYNENHMPDNSDFEQINVSPTYDNGTISMTLPKLEAGTKKEDNGNKYIESNCYKITYTYDLSGQDIEKITQNNSVIVKSEGNHQVVTDDVNIPVVINKQYTIQKSGYYESGTGKIKWTIVINDNRVNIAGAQLKDDMLGQISQGTSISVEPKKGYTIENGVIKFSGVDGKTTNNERYTITYYTDADRKWDDNKPVKNDATFDPTPGKPGDEKGAGTTVTPPDGSVSKECKGKDEKTGEITWKVAINIPASGLPKGTKIIDNIANDKTNVSGQQWMNRNQIEAWKLNLVWKKYGATTNPYVPPKMKISFKTMDGESYSYDQISLNNPPLDNKKFIGFEIEFLEDVKSPGNYDDTLYFEYKTKVDLSNTTMGKNEFYNTGSVGDKTYEAHYDYYKAGVEKMDGSWNSGTTNTSSSDGSLSWKVKVQLDDKDRTKLTVKDTLPEGVTLNKLSVSGGPNIALNIAEDGKITGQDGNFKVTGTYNAETGVIELNLKRLQEGETLYKKTEYIFHFDCQTDITGMTSGDIKKFTNKVEVTDIGSSEQTQNWTYVEHVEEKKVLDKSGSWDNNNRLLKYSIQINPDGKDLVDKVDELTLTDDLRYNSRIYMNNNSYEAEMKISLLHDSVKLYYAALDENGKPVLDENGKMIPGEEVTGWSWRYDILENKDDPTNLPITNRITLTHLPDATPMIMEYNYTVSSTIHKGDAMNLGTINNSARLEGTAYHVEDNRNPDKWEEQTTSGGVTTEKSYTFYKVEAGKFNAVLQGAQFSVYQYDEVNNCYHTEAAKAYITDDKGIFQIRKSDNCYQPNTLYKVVETAPPANYLMQSPLKEYYFYFSDKNAENHLPAEDLMPEKVVDLSAESLTEYVENEKKQDCVYSFEKVDNDDTEKKLSGAKFTVYEKGADGTYTATDIVYTTDDNGQFKIQWGEAYKHNTIYKVVETDPPKGYQLPDSTKEYYFYFSDGAGVTGEIPDGAVDLSRTNGKAEIKNKKENVYTFTKKEQNTGNLLPGAEFTVYKYITSTGKYEETKITYTTDEKGQFQVKFTDEKGTPLYDYNTLYMLEETKAPIGYMLPTYEQRYYFYFSRANDTEHQMPESGVPVDDWAKKDLSSQSHEADVPNVREKKYTFTKVDESDQSKGLEGAEFTVYKYDETTGTYKDVVKTYTTDSNGKFQITFSDDQGNAQYDYNTMYMVKETKAPDGYLMPDSVPEYKFYFKNGRMPEGAMPADTSGAVDLCNNGSEPKITNKKAKTYSFEKVDAENSGKYLQGAEFTVYPCEKVNEKWVADLANPVKTYTTDKNGKFHIQYQDSNGKNIYKYDVLYMVTETKAPDKYEIPNPAPEYYFYFTTGGWGNLPPGTVNLHNDSKTAQVKNKRSTTDIEVKKVWKNNKDQVVQHTDEDESIQINVFRTSSYSAPGSTGMAQLTGTIRCGHPTSTTIMPIESNVSYDVGTTVTFKIERTADWMTGAPKLFFNGRELTPSQTESSAENGVYTYSIVIQDGQNELTGYVGTWGSTDWKFSVVGTQSPSELPGKELVDGAPFTVTAPEWSLKLDDLPLTGKYKEQTVYYTYDIEEIPVEGYETSYEGAHTGIINGTVKITNKSQKAPEYELPETGGPGTIPYTTAGLSIMLMAGFMYTLKSRKGGRRFFRN